MGHAKCRAAKFRPKAVVGGIFDIFHDNLRPKVATDVMSDMVVERVGVDAPAKLGDSRSNHS